MENITEMCNNDIACENYKLFIPTGNYVSPEYLAEEMQSSIDNFEKGFLKRTNAHVSVTFENICPKRKAGQAIIPKAIGSTLRLRTNNDRKTYRKRTTHFQV